MLQQWFERIESLKVTKLDLFWMLGIAQPMPRHFVASDGTEYYGILQSIERGNGSGHSFNVKIANQSGEATFNILTGD